MTNSTGFYYYQSPDEQLLYAHLQNCADTESPQELIQRFRCLFLGETEYSNPLIWSSLGHLVDSDLNHQEFSHILNRCCYILINRWLKRSKLQWAIYELVTLFQITPSGLSPCWTAQRLRTQIKRFVHSEQYHALCRLARVFQPDQATTGCTTQTLDRLIGRYPYLYEHFFLTNSSTDEHRQEIRQMRNKTQLKFDNDLFQYLTQNHTQSAQKDRRYPVKNPTLLSEKKLKIALEHFSGKVDHSYTYQDQAQLFLKQTQCTRSYRTFKEDLYEYLITTIDNKYGNNRFNQRLYKVLQETLSHNDSQKINEVLLAGTCRKLLNFIVVESSEKPRHFVFLDLVNNLGATPVVGLLLKLILICRKVKTDLEKRFSILCNHYALCPKDQVFWLVEALENLNLAFSMNFGSKPWRI